MNIKTSHPMESVISLVVVAVIVMYCLSWIRSCTDQRDFVAVCLDSRGTAVYDGGGKRCLHVLDQRKP